MFTYAAILTLHETFYILNETTEIKDNFYLPKKNSQYLPFFLVYHHVQCTANLVLFTASCIIIKSLLGHYSPC